MTRRIWLIDDTPVLHAVAAATVERAGGWEFTGYLSGAEALRDLDAGTPWPEVILMDYYIGAERGDRVTSQLRSREPATIRPVIVGYSSVRSASQTIVAAGADLIVPKHQDDEGINPSLLAYLRRWAG
jgi:CheY-like chemotaxis protein